MNIKIGVAQGLFLRALRICDSCFLDNEIAHIKESLMKLAYTVYLLDKALSKAKTSHFRSDNVRILIFVIRLLFLTFLV